ncbi:anti-sigma-I factor RsgI family protein [Alteribacter populi]|uniref:anti-sigma-I factor RsgI family protein n=1 Tax=Alteribacter populi TaxID=2011011 RepID=UPI000BBA7B37|nr:anti-sigma factor domain-containing protein [Alteribacter populi]
MKKGVVMEKHKRFMIVLTKDGKFVKARRSAEAILGEEVPYLPKKSFQVSMLYQHKTMAVPIVAILCFFIFFAGNPFLTEDKAYGVVAIDINPSIGLTLDRDYKVVKMNGYNEEGRELINQLDRDDYIGRSFDFVSHKVLDESKNLGYLDEGHSVYISTPSLFHDDQHWLSDYEGWTSSVHEEYSIDIISLLIDELAVKKADQQAVSPGKMAIFQSAEELGIAIEELKDRSMAELVNDAGNEADSLVHSATSPANEKNDSTGESSNKNYEEDKAEDTKPASYDLNKYAEKSQLTGAGKEDEKSDKQDHPEEKSKNKSEEDEDTHPSPTGGKKKGHNKGEDHPSQNGKKKGHNKGEDHPSQNGKKKGHNKGEDHPGQKGKKNGNPKGGDGHPSNNANNNGRP